VGEDELIAWVKTHGWDDKWTEGLGSGANRMEAYLLALGRAKSKKAVPAVAEKIRDLVTLQKPSTTAFRIVSLVSQMLGDPALAAPLAELLARPNISGHAIKMGAEIPPVPGYDSRSSYSQTEKNETPREVNLAAALYRVGDKDGTGEAILKAYADDPRGFYANYARRVLAEKGGK
jgi:hypothetical protein